MKGESKIISSQTNPPKLTKSHFVLGQRCQKALYLDVCSDLRPTHTSLERKTLAAGKAVGDAPRKIFPNGVLIQALNATQVLQETQRAIDDDLLTLYEAAFSYDNVLIRVDILSRKTPNSPWDFYEVKATTYHDCTKKEKEEYCSDIAIQVWVLQKLGIPLQRISLMHLNRECRYPNLENLFEYKDYSLEIVPELADIESHLHTLRTSLTQPTEPPIFIGAHCEKPRECPFQKTTARKKSLSRASLIYPEILKNGSNMNEE